MLKKLPLSLDSAGKQYLPTRSILSKVILAQSCISDVGDTFSKQGHQGADEIAFATEAEDQRQKRLVGKQDFVVCEPFGSHIVDRTMGSIYDSVLPL